MTLLCESLNGCRNERFCMTFQKAIFSIHSSVKQDFPVGTGNWESENPRAQRHEKHVAQTEVPLVLPKLQAVFTGGMAFRSDPRASGQES